MTMRSCRLFLFAAAAGALWSGCAGRRGAERAWGLAGTEFMVAADHPLASRAGERILAEGGNAADAAAAVSFALAVVRPEGTGLGGGGFMLLSLRGREPVTYDYRETAPAGSVPEAYLDAAGEVIKGKTVTGPWAVGVPGLPRGIDAILRRHGTMSLAKVLEPAIRLAEGGFPVDAYNARAMARLAERIAQAPDGERRFAEAARIFLKDGKPYPVGATLRRPDLARTMRRMASLGVEDFYRGELAGKILEAAGPGRGPMTRADLESYAVKERVPLKGSFRGFSVYGMPPPSSGGACLIQILNVMDRVDPKKTDRASYFGVLVEAMKHAFADRAALLGDADAHPEVGSAVAGMISPERAARLRELIGEGRTRKPEEYGSHVLAEDGGTSHYSIIDKHGNAVAATETINLSYGSMVVPEGTGIVLNNELDDFAIKTGVPNEFGLMMSERNRIGPGRRPLSSMSPTILMKDGRPAVSVGASGGPMIITATLQTILRMIDDGLPPDLAVAGKRVHHQWSPNKVYHEEGLDARITAALERNGHALGPYPYHAGMCQTVRAEGGRLFGAGDPRKGGRPAGR